MSSPIHDNFYMPAEWHPHNRCWMVWANRAQNWAVPMSRIQANYAAIVKAIVQFEPVTVIVDSPEQAKEVKHLCSSGVDTLCLPFNDTWVRDTGPTFLVNGQGGIAGVDWRFNAWGETRENSADYQQDTQLAQRLLAQLQIRRYAAPLILEGGSIHVDGEGTLLTSEECLLNPNRNPHLTRHDLENLLHDYLGITKIIWLGQGLQDDETNGHVDNLATFVRPGVVLALISSDPQDSNYNALQDNLQRLRHATDAKGRKLDVMTIEQPAHRNDSTGLRLALSYINFYLANGGVVMPIFADSADQAAIDTIKRVFPDHQVITVPGLDLVYGGGCIHCMTQQQPQV